METAKSISKHLGFIFHESKLQFFGLNGKCCTDNIYTNYIMDMFPVSGDLDKNAFSHQQVGGDFFKRTMNNFLFNTEGGEKLNIQPFAQFAVDYGEEVRHFNPKMFTIVCLYLWNIPEDMNEVPHFV